ESLHQQRSKTIKFAVLNLKALVAKKADLTGNFAAKRITVENNLAAVARYAAF
ncbi:Hypothetical protein FKW44_001566, partial [Caligus rogercresseyi]